MSHTPDSDSCLSHGDNGRAAMLPVDPYRSLRPSFGMLVGVSDFEAIDAYHRGKMWLHNAWLHGGGVVWGLDVKVDLEHGEIRVLPGLAVDRAGRELHLEHPACLDVGRWYEENASRSDVHVEHPGGDQNIALFDAYVAARFKSCLTRPVPALSEPCEGSQSVTSYSRVFETIELLLLPLPDPAPQDSSLPHHRLRLLFGVDPPRMENGAVVAADQEVLDRLASINGPAALLSAFRRFAALDAVELRPPASEDRESGLFPVVDPTSVVLANVTGLRVERTAERWRLTSGAADTAVRRALVATSTIQELLCGPGVNLSGGAAVPPTADTTTADAGGPRIDLAGVRRDDRTLLVPFDRDVVANSVKEPAIAVFSFDPGGGWLREDVRVDFDAAQRRATITLLGAARGDTLRLIVRGAGDTPVLGGSGGGRIPLAGAVGGPPGGAHNGHDFVFMFHSV